ncbi:MAG: hypothetical protein AAF943_04600 [Pseudomonadota bacterium]
MPSAREIYQKLLDDIGDAFQREDFDVYVTYFVFPQRVQTFDRSVTLNGPEDLQKVFERMLARLNHLNIVDFARVCLMAQQIDDTTIYGYHETKLINRDLFITEAYTALSVLRLMPGGWRVSDNQYAEIDPLTPSAMVEILGKH